jgi:hypothetical protein
MPGGQGWLRCCKGAAAAAPQRQERGPSASARTASPSPCKATPICPHLECVHCSCCLLADFDGLRIWNLSAHEICLDLKLGAVGCAAALCCACAALLCFVRLLPLFLLHLPCYSLPLPDDTALVALPAA